MTTLRYLSWPALVALGFLVGWWGIALFAYALCVVICHVDNVLLHNDRDDDAP